MALQKAASGPKEKLILAAGVNAKQHKTSSCWAQALMDAA